MSEQFTRRDTLRTGLTAAGLLAFAQERAVSAPTLGETDIPFTDYPKDYKVNGNPKAVNRFLDIRKIDGHITPNDQFFFIQHLNRPEIDGDSYRLKFSGMVNKPGELSLADLKAMKSTDIVNGYECSGNSGRFFDGLSSCGRFTGVPLSHVLKHVGVGPKAREVVFFGTDRGKEKVVFRENTFDLDQQFGRSITLENAMKPEPLLAYALNGQPLTRDSGFPIRLIMPGWYGVCNVKWLSEIHLQQDRYLGNFQARWYRDLRGRGGTGEDNDPEHPVGGDRSHPHAVEVGDCARHEKFQRISGVRLRVERRHAAQIGGGKRGWRALAGRRARQGQHALRLETLHLRLEERHARRTYLGFARDGHGWNRSTHQSRVEQEKDVPGRQRAIPTQNNHCVNAC